MPGFRSGVSTLMQPEDGRARVGVRAAGGLRDAVSEGQREGAVRLAVEGELRIVTCHDVHLLCCLSGHGLMRKFWPILRACKRWNRVAVEALRSRISRHDGCPGDLSAKTMWAFSSTRPDSEAE